MNNAAGFVYEVRGEEHRGIRDHAGGVSHSTV